VADGGTNKREPAKNPPANNMPWKTSWGRVKRKNPIKAKNRKQKFKWVFFHGSLRLNRGVSDTGIHYKNKKKKENACKVVTVVEDF